MRRIPVIEYDEELLKAVKNCQIVVKTDSLEQIEYKYSEAQRNNSVVAMCVQLPYASISQIDFRKEWSQIPLIINAFNIGDYDLFMFKVDIIRSLNVRIFLSNEADSVFTDLKVMASIGIDCGLYMEDTVKMNKDSFLDLASYYYMSPVPHATIEPFEFILRHLTEDRNEGFESVYFENPLQFIKATSAEDIDQIDMEGQDSLATKLDVYYKHFMDLDVCSKCPAFKICDRRMISKLDDCQNAMNEVFEYAELRNNLNHQNNQKTVCQL